MKYFLFPLLFLISTHCYGQNHDYSWQIGYDNHIDFGMELSFQGDTLRIDTIVRDIIFLQTTGSICDSAGNIQFYTNGCKIFNQRHELMENGSGMGGGDEFYEEMCSQGYRWPQGVLILPMGNNQYQMFHQNGMQDNLTGRPYADIVYRSVIDMNLNNGEGEVILKKDTVHAGEILYGNFSAVQHANGQEWWMILHTTESDSFHILQIDSTGVISRSVQTIGKRTRNESQTVGQAKFTPDGKHFLHYDLLTGLQIFDFNRGTGILSAAIHIPFWQFDTGGVRAGGMEISPNSRYIYISSRIHLDQFDLLADDVEASRIYIEKYDGYANPLESTFFQMQLAPDGKIYMSSTNGIPFMHVINQPDSQGLACDFIQRGLDLPAQNLFSMPYFPNYRLGADSSLLVSTKTIEREAIAFHLFPNPTSDLLSYKIDKRNKIYAINIYNMTGKNLLSLRTITGQVDVSNLLSGMYIFELVTSDGRRGTRLFVKD